MGKGCSRGSVGHYSCTAVVPGPVNVKVAVLIVEGFIARLKVAVTTNWGRRRSNHSVGFRNHGGGAHSALPVVKLHTKLLANACQTYLGTGCNRGGIQGAQRESA